MGDKSHKTGALRRGVEEGGCGARLAARPDEDAVKEEYVAGDGWKKRTMIAVVAWSMTAANGGSSTAGRKHHADDRAEASPQRLRQEWLHGTALACARREAGQCCWAIARALKCSGAHRAPTIWWAASLREIDA